MTPHTTRVLPYLCAGATASALLSCYLLRGSLFFYVCAGALAFSLVAFTLFRKKAFFALSAVFLGAALTSGVFCLRLSEYEAYAKSLENAPARIYTVTRAENGSVLIAQSASAPKIRVYTDESLAVGDKIVASVRLFYENGNALSIRGVARGVAFTGCFLSLNPSPQAQTPLWLLPESLRSLSLSRFDSLFADGWFFKSLVLGERSDMPENFAALASDVGVSHIFAVSGMHVSFLAGAVLVLFKRRRAAVLAVAPIILLFMALCGFTPSVVRAGIMQIAALFALLIRRENGGLSGVFLALTLMLIINPFAACDAGLQLSFAAVVGILTVGQKMLSCLLPRIKKPSPKTFFGKTTGKLINALTACFCVAISAQLFALPLLVIYFGRVSFVSILTVFFSVFAVEIAFLSALVALCLTFIAPFLSAPFTFVAYLCRTYIVWVMHTVAKIPWLTVGLASAPAAVWLVYSYITGYVFYKTKQKHKYIKAAALITLIGVIAALLNGYSRQNTLEVYAPAAASQSVVLTKGGDTAVLGCGTTAVRDVSDYLKRRNIRQIDVLLLNTPDELPGALTLMQSFKVCLLLAPYSSDKAYKEVLFSAVGETGTKLKICTHDEKYDLPSISVLVMGLPCGLPAALAQSGGVRLLATGSIDEDSADYMLSTREGLSSTLLVTRATLFDRVFSKEGGDLSPEYVIITGRRISEAETLAAASVFRTAADEVRLSFRAGRVYAR
jgi:ComEC/Rec2-related protein